MLHAALLSSNRFARNANAETPTLYPAPSLPRLFAVLRYALALSRPHLFHCNSGPDTMEGYISRLIRLWQETQPMVATMV